MWNSCQWWAFIHCGSIISPWLHNHWQLQTREVMRISEMTELTWLLWLSPHPVSLIMPVFICCCQSPAPHRRSLHLLFFPLCCHYSTSQSSPLFSFSSCCLLLVPHLVLLKRHSLHHSLKSSLIFPASVITLSKWLRQVSGMFVPVSLLLTVSCSGMTGAHLETGTVSAGQSCETVSPHFTVPASASDSPLLQYCTFVPCAAFCCPVDLQWNTNCCVHNICLRLALHLFTICFFFKTHFCFTQMTQTESSHRVFRGSKSSTAIKSDVKNSLINPRQSGVRAALK